MIYLYVKTHNKTGLKYLGKTVKDPFKYKGSGKRWLNHINTHGYDVTTEIIGTFATNEELKSYSLPLSESLDIVNSDNWANLVNEEGAGGDTSSYIDYASLNRGKGKTYEERYGVEEAKRLKKLRSDRLSKTRKGKTYEQIYGLEGAKEMRELRSRQQSELNKGRIHSDSTKEKIRKRALGKKHPKCSCILCHAEISINNITNHYKKHV